MGVCSDTKRRKYKNKYNEGTDSQNNFNGYENNNMIKDEINNNNYSNHINKNKIKDENNNQNNYSKKINNKKSTNNINNSQANLLILDLI